ncbi:Threonine aldolase [Aspergillus sclerotialis]|uniref:Threonine aldolase n=1 Tax=Aspergillus sclerotialis TaxID=2070753 RepID=A0A3A2ZEH7_9EURO|nr:Threonine aldolase [Aspergillus sclerotialis]
MLEAISHCTLQDDVMMEDTSTNSFQEFMAEITGHEAALLVLSGTMANQVALRTALTVPPYAVFADHRSHIISMEAGGAATLCGALIQAVVPANGHHLTLEDVKKFATVRADVYDCPTRVISLENTLSGTIMPLPEAQAISAWARSQKPPIHMHLDGARLWEAVAAEAGSLRDYCRCFDTVSLCFTKGLGAPIGSIVVGSRQVIDRARWMRKVLGGGLQQAGIIAAPARVAVTETFLNGRLAATHKIAKDIARMWKSLGGIL